MMIPCLIEFAMNSFLTCNGLTTKIELNLIK